MNKVLKKWFAITSEEDYLSKTNQKGKKKKKKKDSKLKIARGFSSWKFTMYFDYCLIIYVQHSGFRLLE